MTGTDHAFHLRKGQDDPEMVEVVLPERITYKKVAVTRRQPAQAGGTRNTNRGDKK